MDLLEKIIEAKEIKGDDSALEIAKHLNVQNYDEVKMKGSCPFGHSDSNPSFIWDKKSKCFTCFSCGKRYSILDMYTEMEGSYLAGIKRLFKETNIAYNFKGQKISKEEYLLNYKYPKEETNSKIDKVAEYLGKRGISENTINYLGVKQDKYGNIVFESRDIDGTLLCVKYRKSGKVKSGEPKMWYQKDASNCPILWNVEKIDLTKPLAIVEGHIDVMSVVEAGWTNVVTIPNGASDTSWIQFNYDFLENFNEIILWFDNDSAGRNGLNNTIKRLGEYRCKIITPEQSDEDAIEKYYQQYNEDLHIRKTDANNILLACGKDRIIQLINTAEEIPVKNITYLMDADPSSIEDLEKFPTGIKGIDDMLYGNIFPSLVIYSGSAGCVDCDTEFFDGTKWKRIAEYQPGDKVLQYNEDGTAILVEPEQYHKYPAEYLWHFVTKHGIDQCLSDEHNVVYIPRRSNEIKIDKLSNIMSKYNSHKEGFSGRFITTFSYSGKGIDLTDPEIKLMCAVICDGSFLKDSPYSKRCRFHIKKDRKKIELRKIFDECNIEYYEKQSTVEGYTDFVVYVPRREKEFSDYWYNCNQHQLQLICDNILKWDGHIGNVKLFYTNNTKTRDFVQFAFSACGYRTNIIYGDRAGTIKTTKDNKEIITRHDMYILTITQKSFLSLRVKEKEGNNLFKQYKTLDGFKYCFTVPSHMWVMRRNGRIAVTGNSGKSSLANIATVISAIEHGEKAFVYSGELAPSQLSDWILSPLAGYNHIMEFKSEEYERSFFRVTDQAESNIRKFYRSNILLYNDNGSLETSSNDIFNAMEVAYKKFGCRVFLIDNLMSLSLEGDSADSKWEAQKKFIVKLANFTNKYGVNVNLVAHPRKPSGGQNINDANVYSLSGSSDLGNICHRMLWVSRIKEETLPPDIGKVKIEVVKDRPTQSGGMSCEAFYDKKTRRIYTNDEEKIKMYKWESELKKPIEYPPFVTERLIKNKKYESVEECDQF